MNRIAGIFLAPLLLTGCSLTADTFSCAVKFDGAPDKCIDYSEVDFQIRTGIEGLCRGLSGQFSTSMACPTANRVGGCRRVDKSHAEIEWYYSTGAIPQTTADVMKRCASGEMFVKADGTIPTPPAAMDMKGGVCSPMSATATSVTFKNMAAGPISGYWVRPDCGEQYYFTIVAGGSYQQATFVGHIWNLRDGAMIATGTVLKQYPAAAGNPTVNVP